MARRKWHKRILRQAWLRATACFLAAQYIRLVHGLGRWTVSGAEHPARLVDRGASGIVCFWHGRLLMMSRAWTFSPAFRMLISSHGDGQLIADTVAHLGIETIAGSSSKGGGTAFRKLIRALQAGDWVGLTPDGPRGPRMRAGMGAVTLARLSGAPLLPLSYSTSRGPFLSSWDRFLLPAPLSRGVFIWGEPIHVAADADDTELEAVRQRLEESLNQLQRQADQHFGREAVLPAENRVLEVQG